MYIVSPFMVVVLIIIGNFWSDHTVELSINLQVRVVNFFFLFSLDNVNALSRRQVNNERIIS